MEHVDALEAVRRLTLERDVLLSVVVERDALAEQVRRLEGETGGQVADLRIITAERDALAARVKRIQANQTTLIKERDDAVLRANHAENEARRFTRERDRAQTWLERSHAAYDALQAPGRHEHHETDAETGEGGNVAPRGCNVPSWGKIARDVIWCASLALQNEIRLADTRKDWDELRRLQKGKMALDRIRDELSAH